MAFSEAAQRLAPSAAAETGTRIWCADRGDGTYKNPVLCADYSDPDAIRVGEDFWLTASSFCAVPGLPILHSRDLVNWTLVNHALPRLVPEGHFAVPQHGAGVWAPSLRHHAGKFWIFYPDPDFGLYAITADDPRGAWSAPVMVKRGKGLIDPCPFWDEDGTGYLVHGWAKSRAGISNQLTLHRLAADNLSVIDAGAVIIDGNAMPGWHTIEGPKLYKRGGWYYVFAPAGGVAEGYQAVFRARNIYGPFESRIVLERGATAVNGPHQGAWVDSRAGEDWFLHFQERPAYGRVVHLQPMRWGADGWPQMGEGGTPVGAHNKPLAGEPRAEPPTSDEFDGPTLGRQWQWQANPRPEWASCEARKSRLRLNCVPQAPGATLWSAGSLLLQKFPAEEFVVTTALEFFPAAEGDRAGLVVFGYDYAWLGFRREGGRTRLALTICAEAQAGGGEAIVAVTDWAAERAVLRVTVGAGARCQFSLSETGEAFFAIGRVFQARSSKWVGAKAGLFAATATATSTGWAEADWFRVEAAPGSGRS